MKILHLINNLRREGAQMVVRNLVVSSKEGGAQHIVYARDPGGALQQELEAKGVAVFVADKYYGALQSSRSIEFIAQIIEREAVDIIHAHMTDSACLGWFAARRSAIPLVITYHGHNILLKCSFLCRSVYFVLLFFASRYAGSNVAVSCSVKNRVCRWLFLNTDRVEVISNGVFIPENKVLTEHAKIKSQQYKVVSVGRLVELKGHDQIIEAAVDLVKSYPGICFYILGDGPLREKLEQKVLSLGLSDCVIFAGSVDTVADYLLTSDVYISTSYTEGMPVATLEAMAWGIPVIASDIAGNRSIVDHGKTGYLYISGDVKSLADAIKQRFGNYEDALLCANNARQMVKQKYSDQLTSIAYDDVYKKVR